jgi:hypothetical protein
MAEAPVDKSFMGMPVSQHLSLPRAVQFQRPFIQQFAKYHRNLIGRTFRVRQECCDGENCLLELRSKTGGSVGSNTSIFATCANKHDRVSW